MPLQGREDIQILWHVKEEEEDDHNKEYSFSCQCNHKDMGYRDVVIFNEDHRDAENYHNQWDEESYNDCNDEYNYMILVTVSGPCNATDLISHHEQLFLNKRKMISIVVWNYETRIREDTRQETLRGSHWCFIGTWLSVCCKACTKARKQKVISVYTGSPELLHCYKKKPSKQPNLTLWHKLHPSDTVFCSSGIQTWEWLTQTKNDINDQQVLIVKKAHETVKISPNIFIFCM